MNLEYEKQKNIANLIYNYPLNYFRVDVDDDVRRRLAGRTLWTRAKYSVICAVLFTASFIATAKCSQQEGEQTCPDQNKISMTHDVPFKPDNLGVLALVCFAGGLSGAAIATFPVVRRFSRETVKSRSKKLMDLLDNLKKRSLTAEELEQIKHLATFSVDGMHVPMAKATPNMLITKMSELDPEYYDGLMGGYHADSPFWVRSAIEAGHKGTKYR